jgi:hypothetical protein
MIKNIKSIVIVGGGSAGWMSAAILKKSFPQYKITLIESPNFPIIGVGESTLGRIRNFCSWLGLDEKSFMQATDASYKISIRFDDFYEKNGGGYHYPLGQPMLSGTREGIRDWLLKKSLYPETSSEDLVRCFFPSAALFEKNKFSLNTIGYYDNYDPSINSSFHFDAIKFSIFLRDKFCLPAGVEHILDTVTDVVIGKEYALVISTNAGLWRYIIGDTIQFTSTLPYRFRISGRTKQFINAFGEEVIVDNAEKAIAEACLKTQAQIKEYTVAPVFMNGSEKGAHEWLIEFATQPDDLNRFILILDETLRAINSDYDAKRNNNMALNLPLVQLLKDGTFNKWLAQKGKLGGQHKVPRLSNDRGIVEELNKISAETK